MENKTSQKWEDFDKKYKEAYAKSFENMSEEEIIQAHLKDGKNAIESAKKMGIKTISTSDFKKRGA